jgi:hypothetical protein
VGVITAGLSRIIEIDFVFDKNKLVTIQEAALAADPEAQLAVPTTIKVITWAHQAQLNRIPRSFLYFR